MLIVTVFRPSAFRVRTSSPLGNWCLPCWLERGRVYVECAEELCPAWPACFLGEEGFAGGGAGRWQNFPVEFDGHQHWSRPMQRPPFMQGI